MSDKSQQARDGQSIVPLDMKGCICHFTKWQIHLFISKGTQCWTNGKYILIRSTSACWEQQTSACILVQATIYGRRILLGQNGDLDQSETYDIS